MTTCENLFFRTIGPFSNKNGTNYHWMNGIQDFSNVILRRNNSDIVKCIKFIKNILQNQCANYNQTWYNAPLSVWNAMYKQIMIFFSSPEQKVQVSFSDHLSSVACLPVCPSVCKLFTFSFSSPEPLGQFQPNLAQSILG